MNNNLHTVFSGSDCPKHDQLLGYVDNRLPDSEKHRIEIHLIDCEMCSDEVEGLTEMRDPEQLSAIVEELEQRVAVSQSRRFRLNTKVILAAAAVIVLLVGAVFIFRFVVWQNQEPLISEQATTPLTEQEDDLQQKADDEAPPPPPEASKQKQQEIRSRSDAIPEITPKKVEAPVAIVESVFEVGVDETEAEIVEKPAIEEKLAVIADTQAISGMGGVVDGVAPKTQAGFRKSVQAKQVPSLSTMKLAKVYFDAEDYKSASKMFRDIIASDSLNYDAIYHLAFCYHKLSRDKKALKELTKILTDPANDFYPQAHVLQEKIQNH